MSLITTTVREYLEESAPSIKRKPDSCEALDLLNRARRILWYKDWDGTIDYGCVTVSGSCFNLPSNISAIRESWVGSKVVDSQRSFYWSIGSNLLDRCCNITCGKPVVSMDQKKLVFPGLTGLHHLTFQLTEEEETPVDITISYTDRNGGRVVDVLSLSSPDEAKSTEQQIHRLDGVTKSTSTGRINVFQNGVQIYSIPARETHPTTDIYKVFGIEDGKTLVIKGKLKYYKYDEKSYDKYLDLNPDALDFAIQAIQAKDRGSVESSAEYTEKLQVAYSHLSLAEESFQSGFGASLQSENNPSIGNAV